MMTKKKIIEITEGEKKEKAFRRDMARRVCLDWSLKAHENNLDCTACKGSIILTRKSPEGNYYICSCCKKEFLLRNSEYELQELKLVSKDGTYGF